MQSMVVIAAFCHMKFDAQYFIDVTLLEYSVLHKIRSKARKDKGSMKEM